MDVAFLLYASFLGTGGGKESCERWPKLDSMVYQLQLLRKEAHVIMISHFDALSDGGATVSGGCRSDRAYITIHIQQQPT